MENASQALLIAAGVLLAILIISFGVFTFKSASNVGQTFENGMAEQEAQKFNSKFEIYNKANNNVYEVVSAINLAYSINAKNNYDQQTSVQISISGIEGIEGKTYRLSSNLQRRYFQERLNGNDYFDKSFIYTVPDNVGTLPKYDDSTVIRLNTLIKNYAVTLDGVGSDENPNADRVYKWIFNGTIQYSAETGLINQINFICQKNNI